jgi:site-specific DNA recombinase
VWGPSTINGNAARGTGVLNNELYIGRLVWNRLCYRKDPSTGKRRSRLNPQKDWIIKEAPELRIVPQDMWDKAKARQRQMQRPTRPDAMRNQFWRMQRPRYLLSGLMRCGECGSSYTKYGRNRFACAGARDRATCSNHLTIQGDEIEGAILAGLKVRLMEPALFEEFVRAFTAEFNRQQSVFAHEKIALQRELQQIVRRIDTLVEALLEGADAMAINVKLKELETKKAALEDKWSSVPPAEPLLHPGLARIYRDKVERLERTVRAPDTRPEAFEIIRGLIDSVQLTPVAGELDIELRGDLAAILALSEPARSSTHATEKRALQIKLVAGARNHRCRASPDHIPFRLAA